ncbi:hypothetical protein PRZ48_011102 [Zasmidium cellare]|uniref:F-box domain-containing protein n=1 Tax=Zasmidium cellare TaxID=395010 RepID=A0ABR0EAG2_ZASCE|nr:hypothetical protein PRZ48_011102 [Zasmidium cellare]
MSSKLEQILSINNQDRKLQARLSGHFDARSLRILRLTSRTLANFVHKYGRPAFHDIYLHAPVRENETVRGIEKVGPFCKHLTVTIAQAKEPVSLPEVSQGRKQVQSPTKKIKGLHRFSLVKRLWSSTSSLAAPSPTPPQPLQHPDAFTMDLRLWTSLLTHFPNLTHLTLRCPTTDPLWPGRQLPEQTLLLLRLCLERARPKNLRTLTLSPIHAMGVLHLRSSTFGSFLALPPPPKQNPWRNLTTLTINLQNPLPHLDPPKTKMFLSILNDYLRLFSPTLQTLKFIWLGSTPGPSPLLLLEDRPRISWPRLEAFWFGNITYPNRTPGILLELAPKCTVVKTLRTTHRFSRSGDGGEGEAWHDVPLRKGLGWRERASLAASSIYSQEGVSEEMRVSRTSRVVPFMLDLRGQGEILPATRYRG